MAQKKTIATTGRFSIDGWEFKKWLLKNKDQIKLLLAGGLTILTYFATQQLADPWHLLLTAIAIPGYRLALDLFDYWISSDSEVKD
jgi:hypothetical protein